MLRQFSQQIMRVGGNANSGCRRNHRTTFPFLRRLHFSLQQCIRDRKGCQSGRLVTGEQLQCRQDTLWGEGEAAEADACQGEEGVGDGGGYGA